MNERIFDRNNYKKKTLDTFEILAAYFVDIYYNHVYINKLLIHELILNQI